MIIVDAYNFMHGVPDKRLFQARSLEDARDKLLRFLGVYADFYSEKMLVVFDGQQGSNAERSTERSPWGIDVIFSRKGETADTVIEDIAKPASRSCPVFVVSDDRHVLNMVRGKGAYGMSVLEMYRRVLEAQKEMRDAC